MPDHANDPVECRLRRLEQQWRAARAGATIMVVCAVAATTSAFSRQGEPTVRTSRLELVDRSGRVRATLDVGGGAGAWTVVDSTGRTMAALTLEETGQIVVRDADGRAQASLGAPTVHRITER